MIARRAGRALLVLALPFGLTGACVASSRETSRSDPLPPAPRAIASSEPARDAQADNAATLQRLALDPRHWASLEDWTINDSLRARRPPHVVCLNEIGCPKPAPIPRCAPDAEQHAEQLSASRSMPSVTWITWKGMLVAGSGVMTMVGCDKCCNTATRTLEFQAGEVSFVFERRQGGRVGCNGDESIMCCGFEGVGWNRSGWQSMRHVLVHARIAGPWLLSDAWVCALDGPEGSTKSTTDATP